MYILFDLQYTFVFVVGAIVVPYVSAHQLATQLLGPVPRSASPSFACSASASAIRRLKQYSVASVSTTEREKWEGVGVALGVC